MPVMMMMMTTSVAARPAVEFRHVPGLAFDHERLALHRGLGLRVRPSGNHGAWSTAEASPNDCAFATAAGGAHLRTGAVADRTTEHRRTVDVAGCGGNAPSRQKKATQHRFGSHRVLRF
jgi:hypothetical protein